MSIPIVLAQLPAPPELVVLLVIIILLFGADKLPKLARGAGEAVTEFQEAKEKADNPKEAVGDKLDEEQDEASNDTSEADGGENQ